MSSSEADSSKIKKQIVIRYPLTFYEEVSRALIHYKTYRDNRKYFRAMPVMDELIDFVNIDPITGKHPYEMTGKEEKRYELIELPQDLVEAFKGLYHGTKEEYDNVLGIKHLAPGNSVDDNKATVIIRKPISYIYAYGDHPTEWAAMVAGHSYKIEQMTPAGFPMIRRESMVDWESEDIEYTYTTEIPRSVWSVLFENMWQDIAPVCTRIERIIARTLTEKGINEASMFSPLLQAEGNEEQDDPLDLS